MYRIGMNHYEVSCLKKEDPAVELHSASAGIHQIDFNRFIDMLRKIIRVFPRLLRGADNCLRSEKNIVWRSGEFRLRPLSGSHRSHLF